MWQFINKLFDENEKTIKKYRLVVEQINGLESQMKKLSDKQLREQTTKFKVLIKDEREKGRDEGEILNEILPEAFATVREVASRVLGMRHFDVQLIAGIGLHNGKITEQKTGEGKTLTVTCPLYLNALLEKGVQLITVNDYLAEVGAGWMGQVYHFLGLKTAVIIHDQAKMFDPKVQSEDRGDERLEHFVPIGRQEAYQCDIVYGTNNEFGFDYLRDNMVPNLEMMVQRRDTPHFFAIVDEADSILIDEARTPLIISAPDSEPTSKYAEFARMIVSLGKDSDYTLDEKAKTATLTDLGVKRVEGKLGVKNLYEENFDTIHYIENALRAQALYKRDKEYIVRDGQVVIVDEHTGRLMPGRRYGNGLHQAIEAKEGVAIQQESRTLATISLQNYFRMYQKLAGMTGTAATEAEEFRKIYKMDVLVVPTHKVVKRRDESDLVYKTAAGKYSALVGEVEKIHQEGRPILIGTRSIDHNQIVAKLLNKKGIKHEVLNAKNNEREAFIIAQAGVKGAITVATNIAGRGVDIVLGGAKPEMKDFRLKIGKYDHKKYEASLTRWKEQNQEVIELGGLAILGAERHESRRIDNQLRGRAGRQGDPGSSRFYVALEDEIMRIFVGDQIAKLMGILKIDESQPIEAQMVNKSIESAQTKVEGFFFDQRQRLVEFDDVMNKQREIIYKRRRRFLELSGKDLVETSQNEVTVAEQTLRGEILGYFDKAIKTNIVAAWSQIDETGNLEVVAEALVKFLVRLIPFDKESQNNLQKRLRTLENDEGKIETELQQIIRRTYQAREETVGKEVMVEMEKQVMLGTIDQLWMDHLDAVEDLRQGIWMRGDKNTVVSEYKKEAFLLFESLIARIEQTVMERVFRVQVNPQVLAQQRMKEQMEMMARAKVSAGGEKMEESLLSQASMTKTGGDEEEVSDGSAGALAAAIRKQRERGEELGGEKIGGKVKKVGRNDPCPCGSGLKYKKCHGKVE
jgi:preprotein translocase subunit SecA